MTSTLETYNNLHITLYLLLLKFAQSMYDNPQDYCLPFNLLLEEELRGDSALGLRGKDPSHQGAKWVGIQSSFSGDVRSG
jgi:hypothetical protein